MVTVFLELESLGAGSIGGIHGSNYTTEVKRQQEQSLTTPDILLHVPPLVFLTLPFSLSIPSHYKVDSHHSVSFP